LAARWVSSLYSSREFADVAAVVVVANDVAAGVAVAAAMWRPLLPLPMLL